jgi:hypothetical protein
MVDFENKEGGGGISGLGKSTGVYTPNSAMDLSGGLLADVPFAPALSRDELRKISNPTMTDKQKELTDRLKNPWSEDWQGKEDYFSMQEMTALAERKAFGHGTAARKFETFNSLYQAYQQQAAQGIAVEQAELKQVQQIINTLATVIQFIAQSTQRPPTKKSDPDTTQAAPITAGSMPEFSRQNIDNIRRRLSGVEVSNELKSGREEAPSSFWNMMVTGDPPPSSPVSPSPNSGGFLSKVKEYLTKNWSQLTANGAAICKAFADFAVANAERHFTERGADIAAYVSRESAANSIYAGVEQNKQQLTQTFGNLISRSAQYVATWVRWNKMSELNMLFGSILGVDGLNFSPWNPQMLVDAMIDASITGRADKYGYDKDGKIIATRRGFDHFIGQYGERNQDGMRSPLYEKLATYLGEVGPAYAHAMSMYKKGADANRNNINGSWDASEKGVPQHSDITPDKFVSMLEAILENPSDVGLPDPAKAFERLDKSGSRETSVGALGAAEAAFNVTAADDWIRDGFAALKGEE